MCAFSQKMSSLANNEFQSVDTEFFVNLEVINVTNDLMK